MQVYIIDFGNIDPTGEIMGLIGMDLLKQIRAIIDIELPEICLKK